MKTTGRSMVATGAMALALLLDPAMAAAQSVDGYRLPGATVRPAPGAQGPVDRDNPVVTTAATPRPSPTPTATPTAPPAAATPQPGAQPAGTSSPAPRPAPAATRPAAPQASTPANAAPVPPQAVPLPLPGSSAAPAGSDLFPSALPTAAGPAATPVAAPVPAGPGWYWPWLAGAAALLAALFAALWWRKRRIEAPLAITFEPPVVPPRQPATPVPAAPASGPAAPADPLPQPRLSAAPAGGLTIELESRRMNASLVATTLSYVLRVTNHGDQALSGLAIAGDMIAAHASLPPEAQIASERQRLEHRHALPALAPGESAEVTGDFRLPLTAINPIRAGTAAYFVPLARLRVEAVQDGAAPLIHVQTWVIGELPEAEGAALKPFRLDLGPRTYSRIGQRAVN